MLKSKILNTAIHFMNSKVADSFINKLNGPVRGPGEFSKRIKERHHTFWKNPDAEKVRNTILKTNDDIVEWRDVEYWQRKLSNKYNARIFAEKLGCRVPALFWRGKDPTTIKFSNLPKQFVIKPSIGHSCEHVFLIDSGRNLMDNNYYTNQELVEIMTKALNKNHYLDFLIEEFVRDEKGEYKIPDDYKLFMFNGELAVIELINRYGPKQGSERSFDEQWNPMFDIAYDLPRAPYQSPPKCLEEIISCAKKLSKAYEIFVRIDFYATDKGAVFGEFTPTPSKGDHFTIQAEEMLIKYWNRFCNNMI